ncbi:hypothetical protein LBMAG53_19720 [Planctomycetota bacterium]|nr:hypothetical protein LBMAG53_19720 [Planctomycetota bacterium]
MNDPAAPSAADDHAHPDAAEVFALAGAFARHEIDDAGLARLHGLLVAPGEAGRAAARVAWQAITTDIDLRLALNEAYPGQVAMKVAATTAAGRDRDRGFLANLFARLGGRRPGLSEIKSPPPRPRGLRMAVVAGFASVLLAIGTGWLLAPAQAPVRVVSVVGAASAGGSTVVAGSRLGPRPVALAAGARLVLLWDGGTRAEISGPASLVPVSDGLSLASGWLQATVGDGTMALGLPEGQLRLDSGADAIAEVIAGHGAAAVHQGHGEWRPVGAMPSVIVQGQALDGSAAGYRSLDLIDPRPPLPWLIDPDPLAGRWTMAVTIRPSEPGWSLTARCGMTTITITGSDLVYEGSGRRIRCELAGPVLRERRLACWRSAIGACGLSIDGATDIPAVDWPAPPSRLDGHGATLNDGRIATGPRADPMRER